jgi:hypothetical protein
LHLNCSKIVFDWGFALDPLVDLREARKGRGGEGGKKIGMEEKGGEEKWRRDRKLSRPLFRGFRHL